MTPAQHSRRSQKAAAARKKMVGLKRAADAAKDRGGAPVPQPRKGEPVGYKRVLAATVPNKSSAQIAAELGITPAAVRAVWRRHGLPRRPAGKRPWLG